MNFDYISGCPCLHKQSGIPLECDNWYIGLNSHFIGLIYISVVFFFVD